MNKRVLVGMSGGVDSSVAALLLKKQGYEVVGLTFKFVNDFNADDAINVCNKLEIEHYVLDYQKEFKDLVIDRFIKDYSNGITPNPCVVCNKEVKFNFLYKNMIKYNCDYIATGHYARIMDGKLYKSDDLNKDQTYFLSQLSKEQLERLLLPLEGITKEKVREIARENDLINADKKDSFDVCFIQNSFNDFVSEKITQLPGDIIDIASGQVIGRHKGLSYYTIGQRRGLDIGGFENRMFVARKDIKNNILYIAIGEDNNYLLSSGCIISDINLNIDKLPEYCSAKFRYRQPDIDVKLKYLDNEKILVEYNSIKGVTPGQMCVLYIDDLCIGGGVIESINYDN